MAERDTQPRSQSQSSDARCCGVVQEATSKSMDRRNKRREKPQPWIVLKMTIGFALGIIAYASYVYIGRFCVPMIKNKGGSLGGRRVGGEYESSSLGVRPLNYTFSPFLGHILYPANHDVVGLCIGMVVVILPRQLR